MSLVSNGCSKYIDTRKPKLQYADCNITFKGKFATKNGNVLIKKEKFVKMITKCARIKKLCELMRGEIKEYNERFTRGE